MSVNILSQATRVSTSPSLDWFTPAADLSTLWPALISGRARIVDSGDTLAHHYLQVVTVAAAPRASKMTRGRVEILERVLLGDAPKVVAMEVGCSVSTIAMAVGDCLRAMGLSSGRVPALLVLLLHALRGKVQRLHIQVESTPGPDGDRQLVTSSRLESSLGRQLSASELVVVSMLVEGKTYLEIAQHRQNSVRTVANQIGSAYRKLGVSGRMDLLCYLVSRLETKSEFPTTVAREPLTPMIPRREFLGASASATGTRFERGSQRAAAAH